ncbi:hypothetical protein TrVE_jg13993 [Triparma verrucosa]|uniref:Deoxyribodipyrimidine photo-lyase n=1 Tax=Triparma verrucosa TaxID=1606542 RepID=A0A9W7KUR3_9STRA|nr:hypothetical protein TrVE_jg13993 [Triparma verrucosa]
MSSSKAFSADFDSTRYRLLTEASEAKDGDCVLYWMGRDQRVEDNYAMLAARGIAKEQNVPLKVVFPFYTSFNDMSVRQFTFMSKGLEEVERDCRALNIPFMVKVSSPDQVAETVSEAAKEHKAGAVVTDHMPLKIFKEWNAAVAADLDKSDVPLFQVDAANVVPVWVASDKQEVGARTLRPKINKLYSRYLKEFDKVEANTEKCDLGPLTNWEEVLGSLDAKKVDLSVSVPSIFVPGRTAAMAAFQDFCDNKLKKYADNRNDPNLDVQSGMGPWIRFGQVGFQRLALNVKKLGKYSDGVAAFIEEGVVRRELSDNFCFYNSNYDNLTGAAGWARESLQLHSTDAREYTYTKEEFEKALTHDDLWNAAQIQLVNEGKMHGFLRMYWAKKILEWTTSPAQALEWGVYLNDKFSFDGSCPNGYVGVGWSVMGVHDMGWKERDVFGKIRFMNYNGCKRKFDIFNFVSKYEPAAGNALAAGGEIAVEKKAKKSAKKQKTK